MPHLACNIHLHAGGGSSMVMSFALHGGGPDVTVLVSKAGGRYRVQSDALHALWLIMQVCVCCSMACLIACAVAHHARGR